MRPNPHARRIGPAEPAHPLAPPPVSLAFRGLAGSPLAIVQREVQTLATHPIAYHASALFDGGTINLPPLDKKIIRKIALAANTAEWRKKHNTAEHKKARAAYVQQKRADQREESERVAQIEKIDKTLHAVPPFVMSDAPHGKGLLTTGGYGNNKIEEVEHAQENNRGRVGAKGHGALDGVTELEVEWEDQFVENSFRRRFRRTKEVRMLHEMVRQITYTRETKSADASELLKKIPAVYRVLCCLPCKKEISVFPEQNLELTYRHVWEHHRDIFENWMKKLDGGACPEDHDGLRERHSGGPRSLYCARCGKLLWKAPRLYTHTPEEPKSGSGV